MRTATTCVEAVRVLPPDGGPAVSRVRWTDAEGKRCPVCRVEPDGFHHLGCPEEPCPVCDSRTCACGAAMSRVRWTEIHDEPCPHCSVEPGEFHVRGCPETSCPECDSRPGACACRLVLLTDGAAEASPVTSEPPAPASSDVQAPATETAGGGLGAGSRDSTEVVRRAVGELARAAALLDVQAAALRAAVQAIETGRN